MANKRRKTTRPYTRRSTASKKAKNSVYSEVLALIVLGFGVLFFIAIFFKNSLGQFGAIMNYLFPVLVGRSMTFVLPILFIAYGILMFNPKSRVWVYSKTIYILLAVIFSSALFSTYGFHPLNKNLSFIKILDKFFKLTDDGGIFGNLLAWPLIAIGDKLLSNIVLSILLLIDVIMLSGKSFLGGLKNIFKFLGAIFKNIGILISQFFEKVNEEMELQKEEQAIAEAERIKNAKSKPKFEEKETPMQEAPVAKGLFVHNRPKQFDAATQENTRETSPAGIKISGMGFDDKPDTLEECEQVELVGDEEVEKLKESLEKSMQEDVEYKYELPSTTLLSEPVDCDVDTESTKAVIMEGAAKLESTLASFGVEAKVVNVTRGPAVTRYELQPKAGVKVSRIVNLADDIALNLASMGIRIEAPIPGRAAVGIEVPNKDMAAVMLSEIINSNEFKSHSSSVAFALGKGLSGESVVADIAKMPHMLIAGATGSGKSVCINSLIISLLYKAKPDEVKLVMIDPKRVELNVYNGIPHLLIPVVTDARKAAGALNWAVKEMTDRYQLFSESGCKDIAGYNKFAEKSGLKKLPVIVVIIDELADLMMVAPNEVEDSICRLAQMARAAGMHLVIATQRPSVDIITGIIKANVPSRIAFSVSSQIDSRTILDSGGAEKLLGKGDMLYHPMGESKAQRIKGCFVSEKEVEAVVEYVKSQATANYNEKIIEGINNSQAAVTDEKSSDGDELLDKATELVVENGVASVSLIQRKFSVGYARAARIIDQLEERKVIGGYEGSKPRKVLISKLQWQEIQMKKENPDEDTE